MLDEKYDYICKPLNLEEFRRLIILLKEAGLYNGKESTGFYFTGIIRMSEEGISKWARSDASKKEFKALINSDIYEYKGELYKLNKNVERKNPETREWDKEVSYSPLKDLSITYIRTPEDFNSRFRGIFSERASTED